MGAKAKRQHLEHMPYETMTADQVLMRDEMARGVHQPRTLASVLDEQGIGATGAVTQQAIDIINRCEGYGGLNLSFKQWIVVQRMVEQAYRQGYSDGAAGHS